MATEPFRPAGPDGRVVVEHRLDATRPLRRLRGLAGSSRAVTA